MQMTRGGDKGDGLLAAHLYARGGDAEEAYLGAHVAGDVELDAVVDCGVPDELEGVGLEDVNPVNHHGGLHQAG